LDFLFGITVADANLWLVILCGYCVSGRSLLPTTLFVTVNKNE